MAPKKYTNRRDDQQPDARGELAGVITVIVSAFLFLIMVTGGVVLGPTGQAIFNFMLGVLGFSIYPLLLITFFWGVFKVQKRALSVPARYIVATLTVFAMVVMIVHLATSLPYLTDKGFSYYMSEVFAGRNTGGGVIFGLFVFGVHALFKTVFSFILYALIIISAILFSSEFFRAHVLKKDGQGAGKRNKRSAQPAPTLWRDERLGPGGGMTSFSPTNKLYVDTVVGEPSHTLTDSGSFDRLPERGRKKDKPSGGGSAASPGNQSKQHAKEILFGEQDINSYFQKKPVTFEPTVKAAAVKPVIPQVPFPAPKEFEHGYVSGPILNGDDLSDILARELSQPSVSPQSARVEPDILSAADIELSVQENDEPDYFDRPILNGDAYSSGKRETEKKAEPEQSAPPPEPAVPDYYDRPILNGDRYNREKPEPKAPVQPPFQGLFSEPSYRDAKANVPLEDGSPDLSVLDQAPAQPPVRPTQPVQPAQPVRPVQPTQPVQPAQPARPKQAAPPPPVPQKTENYFDEDEPAAFSLDGDPSGALSGGDAFDIDVSLPEADDFFEADDFLENDIVDGDRFGAEKPEPEAPVFTVGDIVDGDRYFDEPDEPEQYDESEDEPAYFNFINDVEDKSEYSFENENDTTGYYTKLNGVSPEFDGKVSAIEKKLTGKGRVAENQIDITSYARAAVPEEKPKPKPKPRAAYQYTAPPIELMTTESSVTKDADADESRRRIDILENTFEMQGVSAKVTDVITGPAVTKFELTVPPGTSVKRIAGFEPDLSYCLASNGKIRIEAPIPGKRAIGIEVPNKSIGVVGLKDIIDTPEFRNKKSPVTIALGKDIQGNVIVESMENLVHLLIAGTTGSGKSVCLNAILVSLLYKSSPDDVRLILIDPKMVGFAAYRDLPHMLIPHPIIDAAQALNALKWLRGEMDRRYMILQQYAMEKIQELNSSSLVKEGIEPKLPNIVMVIDEYGDLMVSSAVDKRALEDMIMSIASKARAAGIHLILATQRPSRDVVTGTIKANLPSRIACKVSSATESRIILDSMGAEALVGRGDMLVAPASSNEETRVQCAYITNAEVKEIIKFIKENNVAEFDSEFEEAIVVKEASAGGEDQEDENEPYDRELIDVVRCVMKSGQASSSLVQRRFRFGWNKAARIMEQMEQLKFISPQNGTKPREVYITPERFEEFFGETYDE